jgi:hypothetical protein
MTAGNGWQSPSALADRLHNALMGFVAEGEGFEPRWL